MMDDVYGNRNALWKGKVGLFIHFAAFREGSMTSFQSRATF